MEISTSFKKEVHTHLLSLVLEKIQDSKSLMEQIQSEMNNETKSSAGDKYETGRAMMQMERDKAASQLSESLRLKNILELINPNTCHEKIELGSILSLKTGIFFLSASLGKIPVADKSIYCISPISPLGKMLLGKAKGDNFVFNSKNFQILELV